MIAFFFLLALVPVVSILYILFRSDSLDRSHKKLIIWTFIFGMLSVPLVLFVNYLLKEYLGIDLNLYTVTQSLSLSKFSGDILALFQDFFIGGILFKLFIGVLIMALLEECSKAFVVARVDGRRKAFTRIIDGVEFSIAAGLGFSFIENIVYFRLIQDAFVDIRSVLPALMVRALISTLAHVMFSGLFGYYYGKARFLAHHNALHPDSSGSTWRMFHLGNAVKVRFLRSWHFLQGTNLHERFVRGFKQDELIAEGILVATILHAIFNYTLTLGIGYLVVPLLVIEYAMIAHEFHMSRNFEQHQIEEGEGV